MTGVAPNLGSLRQNESISDNWEGKPDRPTTNQKQEKRPKNQGLMGVLSKPPARVELATPALRMRKGNAANGDIIGFDAVAANRYPNGYPNDADLVQLADDLRAQLNAEQIRRLVELLTRQG